MSDFSDRFGSKGQGQSVEKSLQAVLKSLDNLTEDKNKQAIEMVKLLKQDLLVLVSKIRELENNAEDNKHKSLRKIRELQHSFSTENNSILKKIKEIKELDNKDTERQLKILQDKSINLKDTLEENINRLQTSITNVTDQVKLEKGNLQNIAESLQSLRSNMTTDEVGLRKGLEATQSKLSEDVEKLNKRIDEIKPMQGPPGLSGSRGRDGKGVASGGTTGQVLAKASDASFDTEWVDAGGGGGSGDVTSSANLGDNLLIRGDGSSKGVQNSGVTLDDSDNLSGIGNIALTGTVDGRDVATDGTKLDGIETGATADQTEEEIQDLAWNVLTGTQDGITVTYQDSTNDVDFQVNNLDLSHFGTDLSDIFKFVNSSYLDSPSISVTSNGTVISLSIEKSGGGDIRVLFSTGLYTWDTTPAETVTLTAGTDTDPVLNRVYLLESDKTLYTTTGDWPSAEYLPVATVLCQSAASLQSDGAYKVHAWTDHLSDQGNNSGHLSHLNYWIRHQPATWDSGVAPTLSITTNVGTPDNVIFTTTAGEVLQLHNHDFPAFTGTPDIYVVNDNSTPYTTVSDLNALLTDSTGGSMSGKYFALVIWGSVNEVTGDCKLFCNLPSSSYNSADALRADNAAAINYSIPPEFRGTGFLIAKLELRHQSASGGTWTEIDTVDLRGQIAPTSAGGVTALFTEFADTVFKIVDESDISKELQFQCSGITTATTRTLTVPDASGTITLNDATQTLSNKSGNISQWTNDSGYLTSSDTATTTSVGVSELATAAEVNTGTDTDRTITPDALAGSYAGTKTISFYETDVAADLTTGDGKAYVHIPACYNGMDIVSVHAEVITAGTTGTTDIQIHNVTQSVDVLSTKLTIDSGETGSDTAATPAVINTSNDNLTTNDVLRLDIDAVSTTAPKGLIVTLECRLP